MTQPGFPAPGSWTPEERLAAKNAFDGSLVMGVARFNQATGRDRHRSDPLDKLVDHQTGRVRDDLVRDRSCPICGGRFTQPLFVKKGFPHGRCPDCGLIYVSPVLRDETILEHYQDEASWTQVLATDPQVDLDRLKYAYGLNVVRAYGAGPRLLDVGAGTGLFLHVARDQGFIPTGLELHRENTRRLRDQGFRIIDQPLGQAAVPNESFDLVSLWEVLEHIVDPRDLLGRIHAVLAAKGLLLILVPNVDSLVTRMLHEQSGAFGGHSHVNQFNRTTLFRLLDETGYEVLETETLITELGTIDNHLGFEDPYLGSAPAQTDFLTPGFIHDRLLGSKLLVVARKKPSAISGQRSA